MAIVIIFAEVEGKIIHNSFQQTSFTPAPTQASYQSTDQNPSTEFSGQTLIQVIPPEKSSSHVATTQYAKVVCFKCGYPNHLANQCALGRGKRQGGSFPFEKASKNY